MIDYANEDGLHLITMDEESSTICPDWQQRMLEILGEVEDDCDRGASLVLTGAGKFFCNGLNLGGSSSATIGIAVSNCCGR